MSAPDETWVRENPKDATRELIAFMIERDRLREALSGVMQLIDQRVLVRDTSGDSNPRWAINSLDLVRKLKFAQEALDG